MLTDAQVYCMTSMIYLFRPPLTAKAIYRKIGGSKVVHLIRWAGIQINIFIFFIHLAITWLISWIIWDWCLSLRMFEESWKYLESEDCKIDMLRDAYVLGLLHLLITLSTWKFQLKRLSRTTPRNFIWDDGLIVNLILIWNLFMANFVKDY